MARVRCALVLIVACSTLTHAQQQGQGWGPHGGRYGGGQGFSRGSAGPSGPMMMPPGMASGVPMIPLQFQAGMAPNPSVQQLPPVVGSTQPSQFQAGMAPNPSVQQLPAVVGSTQPFPGGSVHGPPMMVSTPPFGGGSFHVPWYVKSIVWRCQDSYRLLCDTQADPSTKRDGEEAVKCLADNAIALLPDCAEAVQNATAQFSTFHAACDADIESICPGVLASAGFDGAQTCAMANLASLSKGCLTAVSQVLSAFRAAKSSMFSTNMPTIIGMMPPGGGGGMMPPGGGGGGGMPPAGGSMEYGRMPGSAAGGGYFHPTAGAYRDDGSEGMEGGGDGGGMTPGVAAAAAACVTVTMVGTVLFAVTMMRRRAGGAAAGAAMGQRAAGRSGIVAEPPLLADAA